MRKILFANGGMNVRVGEEDHEKKPHKIETDWELECPLMPHPKARPPAPPCAPRSTRRPQTARCRQSRSGATRSNLFACYDAAGVLVGRLPTERAGIVPLATERIPAEVAEEALGTVFRYVGLGENTTNTKIERKAVKTRTIRLHTPIPAQPSPPLPHLPLMPTSAGGSVSLKGRSMNNEAGRKGSFSSSAAGACGGPPDAHCEDGPAAKAFWTASGSRYYTDITHAQVYRRVHVRVRKRRRQARPMLGTP